MRIYGGLESDACELSKIGGPSVQVLQRPLSLKVEGLLVEGIGCDNERFAVVVPDACAPDLTG